MPVMSGVEAARARSPLPPEPDVSAANELLIGLHQQFLDRERSNRRDGPR